MQIIENIDQINNELVKFQGKKYKSNCYLLQNDLENLITDRRLQYIAQNGIFFLFEQNLNFDFQKMYFFLLDEPDRFNFEIENTKPIVLEIPFRTQKYPIEEIESLRKFGFSEHIQRDLMGGDSQNSLIKFDNIPLENVTVRIINELEFSAQIYQSIMDTFDLYTGDILTIQEIDNDILACNVIGAFDNENKLIGLLRFYIKNKTAWIGHIVVFPENVGRGIAKQLVNFYIRHAKNLSINNFNHWVVSNNAPAIGLYESFGFKKLNKSSISLIKK